MEQEGLPGYVTMQMIDLRMNTAPLPSSNLHISGKKKKKTISRTQLRMCLIRYHNLICVISEVENLTGYQYASHCVGSLLASIVSDLSC